MYSKGLFSLPWPVPEFCEVHESGDIQATQGCMGSFPSSVSVVVPVWGYTAPLQAPHVKTFELPGASFLGIIL